jgi:hypothetical protein
VLFLVFILEAILVPLDRMNPLEIIKAKAILISGTFFFVYSIPEGVLYFGLILYGKFDHDGEKISLGLVNPNVGDS